MFSYLQWWLRIPSVVRFLLLSLRLIPLCYFVSISTVRLLPVTCLSV